MEIAELLDQAKMAQNFQTDMALAKALGVSRSAVSAWRHGLSGLLWREEAEQRREQARQRKAKDGHRGMVTVVRMPLSDWHLQHFGSRSA